MDEGQLTAARRALSERTVDGKPVSAADSARMVEEEFDRSGLEDLLEKMTDAKPPSVYFGDLHEADTWVWKYQENVDEWWFFTDDYEPVVSVKIARWNGSPLPCVRRNTTMPKEICTAVMQSGLMLFEKSDVGISYIALDKTIIIGKDNHEEMAKSSQKI